ncbi:MAG: RNA-binding protein [Planctomycetia bacterium]|nr:RNA-binding protein [Planctomycetia bacterium]
MARKIYVGNLPWSTTSSDLEAIFSPHGAVRSAEVISDRETGRSRGFGFVEMETDEGLQAAINALNGHEMNGRPLTVNEARERTPRPGGGGGGGRPGGGGGRGYVSVGWLPASLLPCSLPNGDRSTRRTVVQRPGCARGFVRGFIGVSALLGVQYAGCAQQSERCVPDAPLRLTHPSGGRPRLAAVPRDAWRGGCNPPCRHCGR